MEHMITNSALGLLFLGGVSYGTWKTSMSFYREKPTEKGTQDSSLRYHKNIYLVIVSSFGIEPLVSLDFPACQECLLLPIMSHYLI